MTRDFPDSAESLPEARIVEVVLPQHLNHRGNLFGGEALQMMDTAAFIAATRRARQTMVTVSVERVTYEAPVHQGEIVEVLARVSSVGRTSVAVDVEMSAEELLSGQRRRCGTGRFTFVAVGEDERPVQIGG